VYWEIIGSVLASLGGASIIIAAFAHFLGKIWFDRISKQTAAKYAAELFKLKSESEIALENFKVKADFELKDRADFNGISMDIYQDFFNKRVKTYLSLLKIKNQYIEKMNEDFLTEEIECWGDAFYSTYKNLRKLIIENQLYISNDLDNKFIDLRMKAAEFIKEADRTEGYGLGVGAHYQDIQDNQSKIYDDLARDTHPEMTEFFNQLSLDVSKLRARIEIDKNLTKI
jgi:hypothetical protein